MNIAVWVKRLQDPDITIRREAIHALDTIGDPEALVPLAVLFATDPDPEIRTLAQKAGKEIYYNVNRRENMESGATEQQRQQAAEILAQAHARKMQRRQY